ncbi:hypothetical protein K8B33_04030 [Alcanivorax sp. JB21]|uniref:hypothetical protein n=1 Tax=Alcanivorax limicola TaxID=2874102 RepID=UPI001CBCA7D3|nr:hypothetical protein [Alcanivorax limicola]MBZ2188250.1 hypothetical protein [Alcanivorax limicola]
MNRLALIPLLCLLLAGCAAWPGSSSHTPPEASPETAATEGPARITYLFAGDFNAEFYRTLRQQPDRLLIDFPGQDTSINKLPADIAALVDGAAERGSGVKLVAWDDSVQMRSLGMLEIKAVIEGARYLRALGQLSQREMQRLRQRQLGDYDIDLLFDPESGRLLYLHLKRHSESAPPRA